MLEKPYYEMIRDIESDIETKRLAEAESSVVLLHRIDQFSLASLCRSAQGHEPQTETTLWTDRYRPKKFVDLLGDEVSSALHLGVSSLTLSTACSSICATLAQGMGSMRFQGQHEEHGRCGGETRTTKEASERGKAELRYCC